MIYFIFNVLFFVSESFFVFKDCYCKKSVACYLFFNTFIACRITAADLNELNF